MSDSTNSQFISTIQPISQSPTSSIEIKPTTNQISTVSSNQINLLPTELVPHVSHTVPSTETKTANIDKTTSRLSSSQTTDQDIKSKSDISPAIAISDSELACFHAVRYVLRKHKNLAEKDIQFAANYISSFYSHSQKKLEDLNSTSKMFDPLGQKRKPSKTDGLHLTDDQLIMFLVYADQSSICRFALIFNEELDNAIKDEDTATIKKILLGPKEMFVELYDNVFLSNEDREFTIRLVSREMFAASMALELLKKKIINLETIDDRCLSESVVIQVEKRNKHVHLTTLANKCYDEVCLQDAKILEDDQARATMSKYEKPPESVFTVDKSSSSQTPHVYCFNMIDLMAAVTEDIPINSRTNEPFSKYSLQVIQQRFHKEISMYRRYRQIKRSSS